MPGASRSVEINAPVATVFAVITDYDKYAQFLPEVRKVSTSARSGNEVNVHYEIELIKTVRYTLRMKEEAPSRISWSFVEGEVMKDNKGSWVLEDLGAGKTRATYQIEMALGPFVPKSIVNALIDKNLPSMLEAYKKRAEAQKA
jgi:coenzyme Q-binding protein COQ10